ncbi:FAD:protein FMN transferase [Frigidibacter sp. ROC022]|uniref:FAD:protein FMN transferase n=1 Tax=Frigidibacter sp. ROC022 TaxID=2971796 RepID=UPI00215AC6DD|nr:FAD:protein FMN transferase [Frigidibacter sp. ROC022]MCR8725374.1 FAD:protein FMN transferase [Frigidibacter sp. ROC022]
MSRTFSDLDRLALNGATMGTRWAALCFVPKGFDRTPLEQALADAVREVDTEMSLWKPGSALNRLNAAAPENWVSLPESLLTVLGAALAVGCESAGAFEIGVGAAVSAWGFGPDPADPGAIRAALGQRQRPSWEVLELDPANRRARKHAPVRFDLNGIAKGHAVDRMAGAAQALGLTDALLSVDGEVVALGHRPDGSAWPVAIEAPLYGTRALQSVLELSDAAVATSGDYRHWVEIGGHRLSHTMDPRRGGPLAEPPASVTVVAESCMLADAFATALMVTGPDAGSELARGLGLSALFLLRDGSEIRARGVGPVFADRAPVGP